MTDHTIFNKTSSFHEWLALPAIALSSLAAACGAGEGDGKDTLQRVFDESTARTEIACACYAPFGYSTKQECRADWQMMPSQSQCIREAFESSKDQADDYLTCTLSVERNFTGCLDARMACDDIDLSDDCVEDYELGNQLCLDKHPLPKSVLRDLQQCRQDDYDYDDNYES